MCTAAEGKKVFEDMVSIPFSKFVISGFEKKSFFKCQSTVISELLNINKKGKMSKNYVQLHLLLKYSYFLEFLETIVGSEM